MSFDWSSQTGAGFLYGRMGACVVVGAAGTMGRPSAALVPKSTLIDDTYEYRNVVRIRN